MKTFSRIGSGLAAGGLSLALLGGIGLPVSASAACSACPEKTVNASEHHQELQAMRDKMLAQEKSEDAVLEKMVAELNKAPESKKVDLEAAVLTKLVVQHHEMVSDWEAMHARIAQFRSEPTHAAQVQTSHTSPSKGS